jgi:hypothetical protein
MATLRIEHAIHDYDLWQKAFDSFKGGPRESRGPQLRHPPAGQRPELPDARPGVRHARTGRVVRGLPARPRLVITNVFSRAGWTSADQDSRPPAQGGMQPTQAIAWRRRGQR